MNKKEFIKKVFEKEFNEKRMHKEILNKVKEKEKINSLILKMTLSTCVIMILFLSIYLEKGSTSKIMRTENYSTSANEKNYLNINKVDVSTTSGKKNDGKIINFDIKKSEKWIKDLKSKIVVPECLSEFSSYKIYLRNDTMNNYDILKDYVFDYYNEKKNKNIRIAFSKNSKPLRDYLFDSVDNKSYINGIELVIYQYDNSYYVEFYNNDCYYDIETNNVTIEEVKLLLKSIIE